MLRQLTPPRRLFARGRNSRADARRRFFRPLVEQLEGRRLLAIDPLSFEQVQQALQGVQVTGATIVTHGFQLTDSGGDSLLPVAQAVQQRVAARKPAEQNGLAAGLRHSGRGASSTLRW